MGRLIGLLFIAGFLTFGGCAAPTVQPSITVEQKPSAGPISAYVRRIFEDDRGNMWFATNGDGVARMDGQDLVYFNTGSGLAGNQVTGIIQDQKGKMWFSTTGGVSCFDPSYFPAPGESQFKSFRLAEGLSSVSVWSIFEDSRGTIWAGTAGGLCKLDGDRFVPFEIIGQPEVHSQSMISPKLAMCIREDKSGNLWFGMDGGGVCIYNPNFGTEKSAFAFRNQQHGMSDGCVTDIVFAQNGDAWISTMFGGVNVYDGLKFTYINKSNTLGDNEVWDLYKDKAGNMWLEAEGHGLYRYDGRQFTNWTEKDGLKITAVQAIMEDSKGRMWIGGGGGVYRLEAGQFTEIKRDGPW